MKWRVTDWPSDWLNLIEPLPDPDDPTRSVEVVNNGSIVFQVEETALFGNFQNEVVVVSTNAGDYTIKVSGNIDRHPDGKITDFGMRPPRRFDAGDIVKFRYRIDNSGRTNLLYRVTFIVTSPTNTVIYDSSVAHEDVLIEVDDAKIRAPRSSNGRYRTARLMGYTASASNCETGTTSAPYIHRLTIPTLPQ